ncbi:MAG: hypothetical protein M1835_007639 [Candelina submexicana]|nr:MAG: hypothetical protein M1835_007639 [Candelina submexicana]
MVGMNAVGNAMGAMPMMNNGVGGVPRGGQGSAHEGKQKLNTHIYDYFIKNELYDCARAMIQSDCPISTLSSTKTSPGRRRDGEVNGIDENGMDTDSKDEVLSKRPDDLPVPDTPQDIPEGSFLYDWWCLFWDVFSAQRTKKPKHGEAVPSGQGGSAMQYVQHTQASRMRQEQQQQMLRQMNPQINQQLNQQYQNMMRGMPPGGMNMGQGELRQKALQNSRNATPQMVQQMKSQQLMHQQMQRDGSDNDINGQQRPNSPSSAENAPSPSKRPRLDGGPFVMPNGRGQPQGMPGQQLGSAQALQANQLLAANGINPNQLTASQFNSFQQQNPTVQQRSIQVYAQNLAQHQRSALNNQTLPKTMNNAAGVPNQGSPMMQGADVQNIGTVSMDNFYSGQPTQMRGMQGANGQGNHALHDYQMQLMLLEQQNKKRLMMARQEQDLQQRPDGAPGPNGQAAFPPGMSPQGSRSGQSPGPNDQMKRGTPKINPSGLPGSPLPDGSMPNNRASPAPMNFQPGQMPPEMTPQLYQQQMKTMGDMAMGGVPHGNVMRPPSSHPQPLGPQFNPAQLELIARQQQQQVQAQQAGRMPNGAWQQGPQGQVPMMQQPPQGQQSQPMGTPQTRNQQMPPPQAPPAGANANGRTQPSSPQPPVAPSPQQSNKANPKAKKDGKPKRPTKKGSTTTAATPSSEADPAPTPTPSTPITPQNPNSFNLQKGQNGPVQTGNTQAPTSAPAPAPLAQPPEQNHVGAFGPMDDTNNAGFDLTFGSLDTGDVLESFDFDSYLTEGDASGGPFNFDPSSFNLGNPDGVEAGTGDV